MGSDRQHRSLGDHAVPSPSSTVQRGRTARSFVLRLQSTVGNQAVSRLWQSGSIDSSSLVQRVVNGRGQALDALTRAAMETQFAQDLSSVRVHTGEPAAASARALNARAYAVGSDVVFDSGEYAPHTKDGQRLLRHELEHVLEQRTSGERVQLASWDESVSDFIEAADEPGFSSDLNEPTAIGSAGERGHVREVCRKLEGQGYQVYRKEQFDRVPWLNEAFPDGRKRPDMVAVHPVKRELGAIDVTASSSSGATMKPGDATKLPNDWTSEAKGRFKGNQYRSPDLLDDFVPPGSMEAPTKPENTKLHIEKTIDDAEQLARRAPPEFRDFKVFAQDFHWKTGENTKQIIVRPGAPPSTATPGGGTPPAKPLGEGAEIANRLQKESAGRETLRAPAPVEASQFHSAPRSELRRGTPATTEQISMVKAIGADAAKTLKTDANLLRAARLLKFAGAAYNLYGFVSDLAEFTAMASGGLSGQGFVFREHIQLIGDIEREAQQLAKDYPPFTLSLRQFLPRLIALPTGTSDAREIAESLNDNLWNLKALELRLDDRLPGLEMAAREVRVKIAWATTILESQSARVAVVMMTFSTADLARILAGREDLYRMGGMLDRALNGYRLVQPEVKLDIEALEGWYQRLILPS